jgi:hypothetical protein
MSTAQLQAVIDTAWESRAQINALNAPEVREAVEEVISNLNKGRIRVAERQAVGQWQVNQWVKKAVLLSFRLNDNQIMRAGDLGFFDKVQQWYGDTARWAGDADARRAQVQVERLGEVDQRGLGRPVDQRVRQAAVAGDAGDEREAAGPLREQHREDRRQAAEHRVQVGVEHAAGGLELEVLGAHGFVVRRGLGGGKVGLEGADRRVRDACRVGKR